MPIKMKRNSILKTFSVIILSFSLLTSCVTTEEERGYVTKFADFSKISTGISTKDDVRRIAGSPSSISTFGEERWYYIGMNLEKTAFSTPSIKTQDIYIVAFNKTGIVRAIGRNSGSNRRDIAISKEQTRTEGNSMGVVEQLLGNLGRFNANK